MFSIVAGSAPASDARKYVKRDAPMAKADYQNEYRQAAKEMVARNIAILDMETDPFDNATKSAVFPFLAVLYSDEFETVVIWDEDHKSFVSKVIAAIEAIPEKFTIYAHNGGKFDFMFLMSQLRGDIMFKGRGIMGAKIGAHTLRDSFHIIPEKLASFQKDDFDYANMARGKRDSVRDQIIDYCIADCRYLLDLVKGFVGEFGPKISIGQAAMAELKKHYPVQRVTASTDAFLRQFFFGGRVECLQGRIMEKGHWKLYDVNSMYPAAMVNYRHPVGNDYVVRPGQPGEFTCFIELNCTNRGALVRRNEAGDTTATEPSGRFFTTIHEYRMALKYGLIDDVEILFCVDNIHRTDFSRFIVPLYERRLSTKAKLKTLAAQGLAATREYIETKKDDIFVKLLLNNAYGKFAQNPRRYKEHFISNPGDGPPPQLEGFGHLPAHQCDDYWIWERPSPKQRFNNVGTSASITGAARADLMEAIHLAVDPVYCDTDSLICRDLPGLELDPIKLGAWDLEAEFSEVIINGKKMYACQPLDGSKPKIRSKGVGGLTYEDMTRIFNDAIIPVTNFGPTITKTGSQHYLTRRVRATAQVRKNPHGDKQRGRNVDWIAAR